MQLYFFKNENVCIDGEITKQMIYCGDCDLSLDTRKL